ncbi:signal transduction histidine kinase [Sphaerochaeta pleomorpha str. Grapes]|uniref:histidine kinase n=1 Tax=Sphaerochaeta pleomorpha (strain ATCC BAA-1885 / DSM 22778 / Grapes) TaxID=158190 RepID=G8QT31_SPHPG|nr:transporter substrate-binding domain-containing protein [Sphaerochaeta pleomorpha]AEV27936.1 signal transduction histidine kinase [Sphaerochaeta pleomorpha str. Grapes]
MPKGIANKLCICLICTLCMVPSVCFSASVALSLDEAAFISAHPTIRIGIDREFVPFEFIDSNGTYSGISSEILALIAANTGLSFTYDSALGWDDTVEKAKIQEIDLLPAVAITEDRKQYLTFTSPYISFQQSIVIKNTNTSIKGIEDLFNRQVAVQVNTFWEGFLNDYPLIGKRQYENVEKALLAVNRGEEVAYIGNETSSIYWARKLGLSELKFIPLKQEPEQQLSFAVRKDWSLLASIIEKGVQSISEQEFNEIFDHWILVEKPTDYSLAIRISLFAGALILFVALVSVFWIRKLKQEIINKDNTQKDLEIEKQKAEFADKEKSRLMARISHEIRTPLNGINGTTYLLEKSELSITQRRYLSIISGATHTMLSLINDILEYSRIDEHCLALQEIHFHLDEIIREILSLEDWAAKQKKLKVHVRIDEDVPLVLRGDSGKLSQILTNLIHNAMKFTLQGSIDVHVSVQLKENDHCIIVIAIQDTGIGMTAQQVEGIFQPFTQADDSISRRFGGSGLGLSIVKGLVTLMQGTIDVFCELGKGCTFTVALPFKIDHQEESSGCNDCATSLRLDCRHALLVVKNKESVAAVGSLLTSYKIKYDLVDSERLAISLLEADSYEAVTPYCLLIMDAVSWNTRPRQLLDFLAGKNKNKTKPTVKTLLLLEDDSNFNPLESKDSDNGPDLVLSLPVNSSVFYNAMLGLFLPEDSLPSPVPEPEIVRIKDTHYRVLVVEDNKINQIICNEVLTRSGFQVTLASNGKEGVEYFKQMGDEVDLILLDLHMDVMNGYEALAMIRSLNKRIPIVITSADLLEIAKTRALGLGASEFLGKPYNPDELIQISSELIINYRVFEAGTRCIDIDEGLLRVGGDTHLYNLVISSFLQEYEQESVLLMTQIKANQYIQAFETVHKIKGACGSIGATVAQTLAAQVQSLLNEGYSQEMLEKAALLETELRGVLFEGARWKERYETSYRK